MKHDVNVSTFISLITVGLIVLQSDTTVTELLNPALCSIQKSEI